MRFMTSILLPFLAAGSFACELKVVPGDTDTDDSNGATEGSSGDGSGTESGTASSASTTTTGNASATATATSSTSATTGMTTDATSGTTSVGTVETSTTTNATITTTTGDPVDPVPCDGPAVEIVAKSLAYTQAQIPPDPNPTTGSSGSATTGGDPLHPDTLHVRLSSQANMCADPDKVIACGPNWEVSIVIPPEFQVPGLYHLLGPDVIGSSFETGVDNGGGDCSFGGGSFSATFELISVDDKEVVGRLCHVDSVFFDNDVDLEGSFTAPRCP